MAEQTNTVTMDCEICYQPYDENTKQPRVLPCGHTFCHYCMNNTLRNNSIICSLCRTVHNVSQPQDLPINFALLKLTSALTSEIQEEGACNSRDPYQVNAPLVHDGVCFQHGYYRTFKCEGCNVWVCKDCLILAHPKDTCTVVEGLQVIEKSKRFQEVMAESLKSEFVEHLKHLRQAQTKLGDLQEKHRRLVTFMQKFTQVISEELGRVNELVTKGEECIQDLDSEIKQLVEKFSLQEVMTHGEALQEKITDIQSWLSTSRERQSNSSMLVKIIKNKVKGVTNLLQQSGSSPSQPVVSLISVSRKEDNE